MKSLVGGVALLLIAGPVSGASTGGSEHFDVALVSERAAIQPGRPFEVGLHMKPEPGWHTYWRNPGDAGLPLRIEWTLPPGFSAGPIEWPVPERFEAGPLASYGYDREVLLMVRVMPPERIQADSVTIAGKFDWLECADVCAPGSATLDLRMPVRDGESPEGPAADLFAAARATRPTPPSGWELSAEAGPRAVSLTIHPPQGASARGGYFFADQPLVVDYAAAQGFERVGDRYRLTVPPAANRSKPPGRLTGVLVLEGAGSHGARVALDVDAPLTAGDPTPASAVVGKPRIPIGAMAVAVAIGALVLFLLRRRKPKETT